MKTPLEEAMGPPTRQPLQQDRRRLRSLSYFLIMPYLDGASAGQLLHTHAQSALLSPASRLSSVRPFDERLQQRWNGVGVSSHQRRSEEEPVRIQNCSPRR